MNIAPDKPRARIGLIASDDAWWEYTIVLSDVIQGDVVERNERLGRTVTERIEHTAWTFTARLLLLLGTDVDSPPDWLVDFNVLISNTSDFTS